MFHKPLLGNRGLPALNYCLRLKRPRMNSKHKKLSIYGLIQTCCNIVSNMLNGLRCHKKLGCNLESYLIKFPQFKWVKCIEGTVCYLYQGGITASRPFRDPSGV